MQTQRAKEIADSPEMVNVTYNGTGIYIQSVNEQTETARVFPLGQPEQEQEVPLHTLIEH